MAAKFYEKIINRYKKVYETEEGYDVKIYVGEKPNIKEFHAHSFILRTQSEFFKTAFTKDIQKKDGYFILNLNNSPKAFEVLLSYMYCGSVDLTKLKPREILSFLSLDEFKVHPLITYIQEILIKNHHDFIIKNAVEIIELTYQKDSFNKLWHLCLQQICDHPDHLLKSTKFLTFNPSILEIILKRDDFHINEITIWEILLKWTCSQHPVIQQDINKWSKNEFTVMEERLSRFIPLIRFCHMFSEDFLLKVYPFKKLLPNDLINNIFAYYMSPNKKPNIDIQPPRQLIESRHFAIFASWIEKKNGSYYNVRNIPYNFKLLYCTNRDGNTIAKFHEKCDNKGATIAIVKIANSEQIVGGYNPFQWDLSSTWKSTKDSFIFSFKNRTNLQSAKVGYSTGDQYSIYCGSGYGPLFGYNCNLACNNGNWSSNVSTSYPKIGIPRGKFSVGDYEVFQVIKK